METTDSDEFLLRRFRETRDETTFRSLFQLHTPYLYLLTLRLTGGKQADAEDIVQEAWLRAVQKLESFRWESSFRTWLTGIALNCYREFLSKQKGPYAQESNALENATADVSMKREYELEQFIQRLSDGLREVLILHDIEGYTHEEIGSHLQIQPGTSKSRLFEARRRLRLWLGKHSARIGGNHE